MKGARNKAVKPKMITFSKSKLSLELSKGLQLQGSTSETTNYAHSIKEYNTIHPK